MKTTIFIAFILISLNSIGTGLVKDTSDRDPEIKIITNKSVKVHTPIIIVNENTRTEKQNSELKIIGSKTYRRGVRNNQSFNGHWGGFNYGFINFSKPDYSIYAPNNEDFMELAWSNSFSMQFNICDYSINLAPQNNFGLVVGIGLEYQRFKFENQYVSIQKNDAGVVEPLNLRSLGITNIKRNVLKTFYLTIPLMMEYQFPANSKEKLYVSAGIMGGIKLHSKTKVVYKDEEGDKHKKKNNDNLNLLPFKADAVARIGYRSINVWGSYTLTHMFKSGKGPELNAYTIGLGFTY